MAQLLLMEDDAEFAFELREYLELHDHIVEWAMSASEALAILKEKQIDLIITDIFVIQNGKYVQDGGISLLGARQVESARNAQDSMGNIPCIAISGGLTSAGTGHILDVAKSLGARHVMPKPFDFVDMLLVIEEELEAARQRSA